MSLLSNFIQYGNLQSTLLQFCESPKNAPPPAEKNIVMMSAQKQTPADHIEQRPASKSLSKISIFASNPTAKVDPRERLLHRLVYKLEMKCRKLYYNFFVRLENIKSKPIEASPVATKQPEQPTNMQRAVYKLNQIYAILFSKYFSRGLIKHSLKSLRTFCNYKQGLKTVDLIANKIKLEKSFADILSFAKKVEKQQIRMDIFTSSVKNIIDSVGLSQKIVQRWAFCELVNYSKLKLKQTKVQIAQKINPLVARKNIFLDKQTNKQQTSESRSNSNVNESYNLMKMRKRISDNSPGKVCKQVELTVKEFKLKEIKVANYLKAYVNRTKVDQQNFNVVFEKQVPFPILKRCEPQVLNSREVNDLYDMNAIFFPHQLQKQKNTFSYQHKQMPFQLAQSSVQSIGFIDHSQSQVSLITPLNQSLGSNYSRVPNNITASNVKSNTFGIEAVNFKNSLVCEREGTREQKIDDRRGDSFFFKKKLLNKQNYQNSADQFDYKFKMENRYDSAKKDYTTAQSKRQNNSNLIEDFSITPIKMNSNRCSVAEPDFGKKIMTDRKSVCEVKPKIFKDQQKQRQPHGFIKISKKL